MAISGSGRDLDLTFTPVDELKTSTAQYWVVGMVPGTSTAADRTVDPACDVTTNATATQNAWLAIGINQTMMSAASDSLSVRLFGLSKAKCAESIGAGNFVCAYFGISTTTRVGQIVAIDNGVTGSASAIAKTLTAHQVVLGRALESGSTNASITIFLNPQLYDNNLIGTIGIT